MQIQRNPVPTVDIIIEYKGGIVLIERKNIPYGWAIPGGFVDYGESLENAAIREAEEETSLIVSGLKQMHSYSAPDRDTRQHTISTVFIAQAQGELRADSDAQNAEIFSRDNLPGNFAFDHKKIIEHYFLIKDGKDPQW